MLPRWQYQQLMRHTWKYRTGEFLESVKVLWQIGNWPVSDIYISMFPYSKHDGANNDDWSLEGWKVECMSVCRSQKRDMRSVSVKTEPSWHTGAEPCDDDEPELGQSIFSFFFSSSHNHHNHHHHHHHESSTPMLVSIGFSLLSTGCGISGEFTSGPILSTNNISFICFAWLVWFVL